MNFVLRDHAYHLGHLQPGPLGEYQASRRNTTGAEGHGLSVSLHPAAWGRIARLTDEQWKLTRIDGTSGQFLRVTATVEKKAKQWGQSNGKVKLFRVWWILAEVEDESGERTDYEGPFDLKSDALDSELYDPEFMRVVSRQTVFKDGEPISRFDYADLLGEFVDVKFPEFDGLWWFHKYDAFRDTGWASRGVIRPHAVPCWTATRSNYEEPEFTG